MSSDALAGVFDALEGELVQAGTRLAVRTARRRRATIAVLLVTSLLALTATASGVLRIPFSEQDDPTANHAASALRLSADEAAVLLRATARQRRERVHARARCDPDRRRARGSESCGR